MVPFPVTCQQILWKRAYLPYTTLLLRMKKGFILGRQVEANILTTLAPRLRKYTRLLSHDVWELWDDTFLEA